MSDPGTTPAPASAATETTTLDKRWVRKMALMIVVVGGFCLWGLYDAKIAYPKRGILVSEYNLREVIRIAEQDNKLARVSTPEPTKELERLSVGKPVDAFDQAKFEWLESLRLVGRLTPAHTVIDDPAARRDQFDAERAKDPGQSKPSPLSGWDIPVQWGIFGLCGLATIYLLLLFFKVKATVYSWDAVQRRLTLPGGASILPSDIAEFDKRKWHKFFVTMRIRPEHPTLGNKSVTLDLYRFAKLEQWVLEMQDASGLAPTEDAPAAA